MVVINLNQKKSAKIVIIQIYFDDYGSFHCYYDAIFWETLYYQNKNCFLSLFFLKIL